VKGYTCYADNIIISIVVRTKLIPRLHDQAHIKQTSNKYEACIKHSLHEAKIKQTSSWLVQLTRASSRVNGVLNTAVRHQLINYSRRIGLTFHLVAWTYNP